MQLRRRVFTMGALSSLVLVAMPTAGGAQTPTVTSVIGSADGLFVDLEVEVFNDFVEEEEEEEEVTALQLDLTFGPEPSVTLPPTGGSVSESVATVDESAGPISLTAELLTAAAEGALGPDGFANAETTVAGVALVEEIINGVSAQQLEEPLLAAELITATCSSDLGGVTGSSTLVDADVLGTALEEEPAPNTEIEIGIPNVAEIDVTLNRQVENPDGSLSVTALVLEIVVATEFLDVTGTLQIGPATCGVVEGLIPAEVTVPVPAQPLTVTPRFTG
jgi:hypothetical protein